MARKGRVDRGSLCCYPARFYTASTRALAGWSVSYRLLIYWCARQDLNL